MKNFLRVFTILLFLLSCLQSVEAKNSFFPSGIKAGINLANISVSQAMPEAMSFKNLYGFTGGMFYCFKLGSFEIQPEFLFAGRGTKYNAFIDNEFYRVEWHNNYLEALILVKWTVHEIRGVSLFILGGPSYGRLIKAKSVIYDLSGKRMVSVDSRGYFRKGELAVVFGGGVEFRVLRCKVSIETSYHLGISNVATSGMEVDYIKNRSLAFLAGISL